MKELSIDVGIVEELEKKRNKLHSGEIHFLLPFILKEKFPLKYNDGYLLHMMPDQGGEVFWVLMDKNTVAIIEIPWPSLKAEPEVCIVETGEYEKFLSSESKAMLFTAQSLIAKNTAE